MFTASVQIKQLNCILSAILNSAQTCRQNSANYFMIIYSLQLNQSMYHFTVIYLFTYLF